MGSAATKVLVADHHEPSRAGVRLALERRGLSVDAEAVTAEDAVRAALRIRPALGVLAVDLPGGGIAAARLIHDQVPEAALVMLAHAARDEDLFAALRAGAIGYLVKDTSLDRLPDALLGVLDGEAALPRRLVGRLVEEFRETRGRRDPPSLVLRGVALTRREWDVVDALREGLGTGQIARRLSVSPVTVRRHISSVVAKLGVASRAEAVRTLGGERQATRSTT